MNRCLEIKCQAIDALPMKKIEPQILVSFDTSGAEGKAPWSASVNPGCVDILFILQIVEQCLEGQGIELKRLQLAAIVL